MTFSNCASPATMLASRRNARLVPTADGVKIAETAQSGGKRDGPRNEARMAQAAQRGTRRHSHHAARIGKRSEAYAQKALYRCCSRLEIFDRSRQGMGLHNQQQKGTSLPALPRAPALADLQSLNRLGYRAVSTAVAWQAFLSNEFACRAMPPHATQAIPRNTYTQGLRAQAEMNRAPTH